MSEFVLIGTSNQGKFQEFKVLFNDLPYELISLKDVGVNDAVEETGATFLENAIIKAEYYSELSGHLTVADDSGLEIDILGGEPGVHSARYAGEDANDNQKVGFLMSKLKQHKRPWVARFRCAIAISHPKLDTMTCEGACEGEVIPKPSGRNGFGYDPIFYIHKYGKTMAEFSTDEKNLISHRGQAALKAQEIILACSKISKE